MICYYPLHLGGKKWCIFSIYSTGDWRDSHPFESCHCQSYHLSSHRSGHQHVRCFHAHPFISLSSLAKGKCKSFCQYHFVCQHKSSHVPGLHVLVFSLLGIFPTTGLPANMESFLNHVQVQYFLKCL